MSLEAVIAHELSHVKSRDVLVLTLASLFSIVASFLMRYALFGAMFGGGYGDRSRNNAGGGMLIVVVVAGTYMDYQFYYNKGYITL